MLGLTPCASSAMASAEAWNEQQQGSAGAACAAVDSEPSVLTRRTNSTVVSQQLSQAALDEELLAAKQVPLRAACGMWHAM